MYLLVTFVVLGWLAGSICAEGSICRSIYLTALDNGGPQPTTYVFASHTYTIANSPPATFQLPPPKTEVILLSLEAPVPSMPALQQTFLPRTEITIRSLGAPSPSMPNIKATTLPQNTLPSVSSGPSPLLKLPITTIPQYQNNTVPSPRLDISSPQASTSINTQSTSIVAPSPIHTPSEAAAQPTTTLIQIHDLVSLTAGIPAISTLAQDPAVASSATTIPATSTLIPIPLLAPSTATIPPLLSSSATFLPSNIQFSTIYVPPTSTTIVSAGCVPEADDCNPGTSFNSGQYVYNRIYYGCGKTESYSNPGNKFEPPIVETYPSTQSACTALTNCMQWSADPAYATIDLHLVQLSDNTTIWECVAFYNTVGNENYFTVGNSSILVAYGYDV